LITEEDLNTVIRLASPMVCGKKEADAVERLFENRHAIPRLASKLKSMVEAFIIINNDRNAILGIKQRLIDRIKILEREQPGLYWNYTILGETNILKKILGENEKTGTDADK